MNYPSAPREALVENLHGHFVADPYRWLEDDGSVRTRAFASEQDAWYEDVRKTWPYRGDWRQALVEHTHPVSVAPPTVRGTRLFSLNQHHDSSGPVLSVFDTVTGARHTLDLALPAWGDQAVVRGVRPSWEGDRLVCMVSTGGSDRVSHHVLDATTGQLLEGQLGPLPAAWVAWLPGGEEFYYVGYAGPSGEATHASNLRVLLHRVGADAADDVVVFGDRPPQGSYYGLNIEPTGRWLTVTVSQGAANRNALWLASLDTGPARPAWREVTCHGVGAVSPKFGPDGRLYLLTDHGAPHGRICSVDPEDPRAAIWREVVPEDPDAVLDDCALLDTSEGVKLLVLHTRQGVSELTLHSPVQGESTRIDLPGAGVLSSLRVDPQGGREAWMLYSDFATPGDIHHYDTRTGRLARWRDIPRPRAVGRSSAPSVHSRLVAYPASDGTTVRMFLVTSDREPPGCRPTIITGYGGFGVPIRPTYSPVVRAWVAAGGHYALACVRGGGEQGKSWHEAGRRRNKKVAVDDFTAAADWMVNQGLTSPEMLAAAGASHGGFLVAAAAIRRPELFAAVLCSDPLLDMVRYEHLGIGATWVDEFGSADDPDDLACLLDVSPYHQVRESTEYPAVLLTGGTEDPRSGAAHVRKMCAALQYVAKHPAYVLMRREAGVGHGARTPRATLALNVDILSFLGTHTRLCPQSRDGAPPDRWNVQRRGM